MMWLEENTGNAMNPKILFATTPTLELAYEQTGPISGDPVVLLHGFPYDVREFDALLSHVEMIVNRDPKADLLNTAFSVWITSTAKRSLLSTGLITKKPTLR